jgi:hypothetical protein
VKGSTTLNVREQNAEARHHHLIVDSLIAEYLIADHLIADRLIADCLVADDDEISNSQRQSSSI